MKALWLILLAEVDDGYSAELGISRYLPLPFLISVFIIFAAYRSAKFISGLLFYLMKADGDLCGLFIIRPLPITLS